MRLREDLADYGFAIEKALAGFLFKKDLEHLDDEDVKKAADITAKITNLADYIKLTDALDNEDEGKVEEILSKYRPAEEGNALSLRPLAESNYLDLDFLLAKGYTHSLVIEDEILKGKISKYLDENKISYLEDLEGNFQLRLSEEDRVGLQKHLASRIDEKKSTKKYGEKPAYVRTGGQPAKQSGAGAHAAGNKKGNEQKADPIKGKHKKDLATVEGVEGKLEMTREKKLEEGILGMTKIPGLGRLQRLAGIKHVAEDDLDPDGDVSFSYDAGADGAGDVGPGVDNLPAPVDVDPVGIEPAADDAYSAPTDDVGEPIAAPVGPDAGAMGPVGPDARSDIESALSTIQASVGQLKVCEFKEIIGRIEETLAQIRATGETSLK